MGAATVGGGGGATGGTGGGGIDGFCDLSGAMGCAFLLGAVRCMTAFPLPLGTGRASFSNVFLPEVFTA